MMPELSDLTTQALLATAVATSLLHTLIPDHWLPFVLIGRARDWSVGRVAWLSGLSALIHTVLSVLLGFVVLGLGGRAAEVVGESLHEVAGGLLVVFGVVYAIWAWQKGGHFHPGGALLHRDDPDEGCAGEEGPSNPEHLHYHADMSLIRQDRRAGGLVLAVIVGINPCVAVLPVLVASAARGWSAVALTAAAYSVPTCVLMVGLSVLGVSGARRVELPWPARYMELASGLLIAALGILFWTGLID